MKKIAMIGVGKLGQDCAEVMSDAGYDVVGYDIEPRNPKFPMRNTIQEAVSDRDIIFIAAPTPHDPIYGGETPTSHLPNKDFDYTIVKNILNEVNKYTSKNQLVVLISTVLPGTVRNQLIQYITNARFIYNPYLIAMGTIKWDMVNPEMVIIGTEDGSITGDAKELIDFYKVFMQNDPRYEVGTWDEAESIKIFYNTFISTKLSLVNMIQDVAETNGNINVDVVTNALKKSTYRIMGPAYMQAALGDAGACHPRDNIALRYLADRLNLGYDLFDSIMTAREVQAERMALRCLKNGKNVTIIGKAYKPAVPYTNGSASMLVGYYIERHGGNLNYYDPNTGDMDLRENWTQVYLIGYWEPWVEQLSFKDPGAVVIDPWRKLASNQHSGEIIHYGDSRAKYRYTVPDSTIESMTSHLIGMFPDLVQFKSDIHLIDATINSDTTFVLRPTEDIVNEIVLSKQAGKSKFVFFACTEALMPHILSKVHRLASILEDIIHESDFIYLSSTPDSESIYLNKLKKEYLWNKTIRILCCSFLNYMTTNYARGFEFTGGYEINNEKPKIFTCFNKLNREHRMRLLNKMLESGLIERGWYSFEGDETFIEQIPSLPDSLYFYIKQRKDLFPIRLNINENRLNPVDIEYSDLMYYKNSYFSIVTETLFYSKNYPNQHHRPFVEDSLFITEKTYRCFALYHPFILMARPHSLKLLREQGFKTFSPYIDESYDSIEDDDQRFNAIVREIDRLCAMQGNMWDSWQDGIREIVDYNQDFFFKNKKFNFTENYLRFFASTTNTEKVNNLESYLKLSTANTSFKNMPPAPAAPVAPVVQPVSVAPVIQPEPQVTTTTTNEIFAPTIEHSITESLDMTNVQKVLDNHIVLNFPRYMDGGGFELTEELLELIQRTGKDSYESALDWCSGVGPFGYALLAKGRTSKATFADVHELSIETCNIIAKENNIHDKINTYVISQISQIPISEQFDLVVANPPHSGDKEAFLQSIPIANRSENLCRIIVDDQYKVTHDFYKNIKKYLKPNADVYITVGNNMPYFINWALVGGLKYIGFNPSKVLEHGGIYHFKNQ